MRILRRLAHRLTYANVMATLALFVALGGTGYAALSIGSLNIVNGAVRSIDLQNGGVRSIDLQNGGVAGVDLATSAVGSRAIASGAVGGAELATGAVAASDLSAAVLGRLVPAGTRTLGRFEDLAGLPCHVTTSVAGTVRVEVSPTTGAIGLTCEPRACEALPVDYPNGRAACAYSTGTVTYTCDEGYSDTNGNRADGCEVEPVDPCAEQPPAYPNMSAACMDGTWSYQCNPGWNDVNGDSTDGCETSNEAGEETCDGLDNDGDAQTDEGLARSVDNGTISCIEGQEQLTCDPGFIDANANREDGCEAPEA